MMAEKEYVIREFLNELRISREYKGYYYVLYGLILLEREEELLLYLTKGLYQQIGDFFGVRVVNVERNIRTVKYAVWEKYKDDPLFRGYKECPSNGGFMDVLLEEVQKRLFYRGLRTCRYGNECDMVV